MDTHRVVCTPTYRLWSILRVSAAHWAATNTHCPTACWLCNKTVVCQRAKLQPIVNILVIRLKTLKTITLPRAHSMVTPKLAMSRPRSCLVLQGRQACRGPVFVMATHQQPFMNVPRMLAHVQSSLLRHIPNKRVSTSHVVHSSSLTGNEPSTDSGDGGKGLPPVNGGSGGDGGGGGDGEGADRDQPEEAVLPAGKSLDNLPAGMCGGVKLVWYETVMYGTTCTHNSIQTCSRHFPLARYHKCT